MASIDDPVQRLVDLAVQAQTRLMLAYMEVMRKQMEDELRGLVRSEFGGEQVHFRKCEDDHHRERDEAIRRDRAAGMSIRAIGRKHHLSKTRIAGILGSVSSSSLNDGTGTNESEACSTERKGGD